MHPMRDSIKGPRQFFDPAREFGPERVHETGGYISRCIAALGLGDSEDALAEAGSCGGAVGEGRRGGSDAENSNVIRDRRLQRPRAWDCFESVCTCCVSFRILGEVYAHVT